MTGKWEKLIREEEQVRRDRSIRDQVFGHYGHACACCGAVKGLTIDHVNGDGKAHREELQGDFYIWLIRNGFPPGFQVLCIPCNSSKGTGLGCKMHDETRNLKKFWLSLSREQRVSFLAWVPELDPERPESIWGERRPSLAGAAAPVLADLVSEYADFRVVADQIGYPDEISVHPARHRAHEFLIAAGENGYTVGALVKALAAENMGVHRNTVHEWLRAAETLGWVRRKGRATHDPYARWIWCKPIEDA